MADGSPKTALPTDLRPAFSALYQHHAPMVRRALRQLGVPPASLEDATQDVFVVLHRRLDDFERGRSLTNWLWGIARGVASGYRRSARRRARLHDALPRPEAADPLDRGVARREASAILDDFLGSLDEDKCAVFVLSELEGRRGPEIAEQLDVNVNTVYARLRAARKRFHAAMDRHRAPQSRPLFAWIPWAWPAWLGKPTVAVGVGALVTAIAVVQPLPEPAPIESTTMLASASIEPAPTIDPAPPPDRPQRTHRAVSVEPPVEPEIIIEIDEDDESMGSGESDVRSRPRPAPSAAPAEPAPQPSEPIAEPVAEVVIGPPPRAPWQSSVVGHRPVHHPEMITPRRDFIDELLRVALRI